MPIVINIIPMSFNIFACIALCTYDLSTQIKTITVLCTSLWCVVWLCKDITGMSKVLEYVSIGACIVTNVVGFVYTIHNDMYSVALPYLYSFTMLFCIYILPHISLPQKRDKERKT